MRDLNDSSVTPTYSLLVIDKDFLNVWQEIQRTLVFDDTWVMSSQWLHVAQPFPCMDAFSNGDISCEFLFILICVAIEPF